MKNAKIHTMVDEFLSERRKSKGGYAEITETDIDDLRKIIFLLAEEKCEQDPDGDIPIEFVVINRRTHEHLAAIPVRYGNHIEELSDVQMKKRERDLFYNLRIAADSLDRWQRQKDYHDDCTQEDHHQSLDIICEIAKNRDLLRQLDPDVKQKILLVIAQRNHL